MSAGTPSRLKRSRRTGDEVRSHLLEAALEVFAERGYAGASTKEISRRAQVAEVLLFRHFGSKAGLFEEAVLVPFQRFVDAFITKWASHRAGDKPMEELVHEYVDTLYGFFEQNRLLFRALLAAQAHQPAIAARLDEQFAGLQRIVHDATSEFGLPVRDLALTTRLSFGLVLSAAVHGDLLFPSPYTVSRETLVDQIAGYVLHGIGSESDR